MRNYKRQGKSSFYLNFFKKKKKTLLILISAQALIVRMPVSIEEPYRITNSSLAILIAMPRVVRVSPVLDLQHCMPKASFPKRRVAGLRINKSAALTSNLCQKLKKQQNTSQQS